MTSRYQDREVRFGQDPVPLSSILTGHGLNGPRVGGTCFSGSRPSRKSPKLILLWTPCLRFNILKTWATENVLFLVLTKDQTTLPQPSPSTAASSSSRHFLMFQHFDNVFRIFGTSNYYYYYYYYCLK